MRRDDEAETTAPGPTGASAPPRRPDRLALALISLGELLAWSALHYSFSALLPHFEAEYAAAALPASLGLTLSLAAMACLAPLSGRWVDRGRAPWTMPGGALLGALGLCLVAMSNAQPLFLVGWIVVGAGAAFCLYEPCFALLTRTRGLEARRAIATVTLTAGFATLVSFPGNAALESAFGWRGAALGMAAVSAFLAAPLLAWSARRIDREAPPRAPGAAVSRGVSIRAAMRRPGVARIVAAFLGASISHGVIVAHMLPLLAAQGVPPAIAVGVAAAMGPLQVAGRLALIASPAAWPVRTLAMAALTGLALASAALLTAGWGLGLVGAAAFVALQGVAIGTVTILRPVVLAETSGTEDYGSVSGAAALAWISGMAAAPSLGGALRALGGADATLAVTLLLSLSGALLLLPRRRA
ncbi:MFS transporter [Albimonas sp. CAU 1670]|uniref:MFS transporter n=1 Tax=Albimonas sp. CAU 1670 TaxID=3032599 RepID=UPI0023D985DA|nr:MFS transporter [Albimonas sp. CAU 1670]MDF2232925.1 MFS transporter [Albimonas sp. CAU 1670]